MKYHSRQKYRLLCHHPVASLPLWRQGGKEGRRQPPWVRLSMAADLVSWRQRRTFGGKQKLHPPPPAGQSLGQKQQGTEGPIPALRGGGGHSAGRREKPGETVGCNSLVWNLWGGEEERPVWGPAGMNLHLVTRTEKLFELFHGVPYHVKPWKPSTAIRCHQRTSLPSSQDGMVLAPRPQAPVHPL